ncbi:MAG: hypothetical protein EOM59_02115 [Clostridia bacterium]|nr:hypothetical protein [Clostridia bacterium]
MDNKKIHIVYYSGTGGTELVAKRFELALQQVGYEVSIQRLFQRVTPKCADGTPLILLYAVHACNAPEAVYKWIEGTKPVNNVAATVISVSGGGEIIPNKACRTSAIKRLENKGYRVTYENMIVMPSNWIIATKKPLSHMLLAILPQKVNAIVDDIYQEKRRRTKPFFVDRFFSCIGELEKIGAKSFGARIQVSRTCTGCGWCVKSCPAGNISFDLGRPKFGRLCHLCLNCIYGCPMKALKPGFAQFVVIPEGYNLRELENKQPCIGHADIKTLTKGYLWSGVRKYLLLE